MTCPDDLRCVVLVVEDEPVLRIYAADIVEQAGMEAVEAGDTMEAVGILEGRTDVRIVFSDVDMPPGPDGISLAAMVHERWPEIELILTSGKGQPTVEQLPIGCVFFSKPYFEKDVIAILRQMAA